MGLQRPAMMTMSSSCSDFGCTGTCTRGNIFVFFSKVRVHLPPSVICRGGKIIDITVEKGAPCGATWEAAARVLNLPLEQAVVRIGLEAQFFCSADPSNWDPIYGKSPVHFAGHVHSQALKRALTARALAARALKPTGAPLSKNQIK